LRGRYTTYLEKIFNSIGGSFAERRCALRIIEAGGLIGTRDILKLYSCECLSGHGRRKEGLDLATPREGTANYTELEPIACSLLEVEQIKKNRRMMWFYVLWGWPAVL
jgi:hypothetical protein